MRTLHHTIYYASRGTVFTLYHLTDLHVWALPSLLPSLELSPDILNAMTLVLWGIASVVVFGDIRYDWINAGKPE